MNPQPLSKMNPNELDGFFNPLLAKKKPAGPDYFVVSIPLDEGGPYLTLSGTWAALQAKHDWTLFPPGTKLYQGDDARRHLKKLAKQQRRAFAEFGLWQQAGEPN